VIRLLGYQVEWEVDILMDCGMYILGVLIPVARKSSEVT